MLWRGCVPAGPRRGYAATLLGALLLGALLTACDGGYTSLGHDGAAGAAATGGSGGSGLPWPSGTNAQTAARQASWAAFRGRPNDVVLVLPDYSTWDTLTRPEAVLAELSPFAGVLVLSLPMWPNTGGSLTACAAGDYDAHWRDFGATLTQHGRDGSVARLGWQFNGNDVAWAATDATAWVACYRQIAAAIRATAPAIRMDWSMGAHGSSQPVGGDAYDCYPGDDVVDIVGIDAFDMTPSSVDEASWDAQCNGPEGLCVLIDFARAHGKQVGVGQWSVVTCNGFGDPGGDNPFFIEKMHETFVANQALMGYETYYNDPNPGEFCTSLWDPIEAPAASEKYVELWGATP